VDVFRAQLQALSDVVDLVTIDDVLASDRPPAGSRKRPTVALTFDDDLPSHAEHALPLLREAGVPATFFLSGRVLHGFGSYWFQQLEALLIAYGERRTAALLGLPEVRAESLARTCEENVALRHRVSELSAGISAPAVLGRDAIAAFRHRGHDRWIHTVEHDVLPALDDPALENAVSRGRDELAAASGRGRPLLCLSAWQSRYHDRLSPSDVPDSVPPSPAVHSRSDLAMMCTASDVGNPDRSQWTICSLRWLCVSTAPARAQRPA
jgi:peptidoglycan/xylan/chitin deacetylase (PgdA/CDA1 family)